MLSNEQLVELVQSGDRDALLPLWEQVRRLVRKYAGRWAVYGSNGVETEDLMQAGFIAVLRAAESFDSSSGNQFTTYLGPFLKTEFTAAAGRRSRKQQLDPLQSAASLDMPLTVNEECFTLASTLEDPAAAAAFEAIEEADRQERLRAAMEEAIGQLAPEQQVAIRSRYYRQEAFTTAVERTVHNKALTRLRHPALSRRLREFRQ